MTAKQAPAPVEKAPRRFAAAHDGMVATAHSAATRAGVAMFKQGGNAVDAAVAAAFALGVCEPAASGLGGQTMMLIHDATNGRTLALDGSSRAPNRATPGLLDKNARLMGHTATTVPSTPAALAYAQEHYGNLKLQDALKPSIKLARDGFPLSQLLHDLIKREKKHLLRRSGGAFFLTPDGHLPRVGSTFQQPVLLRTLRRLSAEGIEDFYNGRIAKRIHKDMEAHRGLLHLDDLARIPWPIEREPLSTRFGSRRLKTFPPPGAGRSLIEMVNVLANFEPHERDPDTPEGAVLLAEVMRRAFVDRRDRPFDPEFYSQVSDRKLLSKKYAAGIAEELRREAEAHGETTHLCTMDKAGNTVSLTQSIERVFGSFEGSPKLGFLYNDYMSSFEYDDMAHPHYLRPNAVPWSAAAPTIVFEKGKPWLSIGSPGSERITTSILQVLLRLDNHSPFEAVDAPRLHAAKERKVSLEAARFRDDIPRALAARGFEIDERDPYAFYMGCVQLVKRDGERLIGVADPRRDGSAGGPA